MTRSKTVTRRATLLAGAATVAAVTLSGCGAGQVAETVNKDPSIYHVNTQSPNGTVLVRGLAVVYGSVQGYPAGGSAPLEVSLYNETREPVTVRVSSEQPADAASGSLVAWAQRVSVSGSATASPVGTGVPSAAEPSGSPAPAPPSTASASPAASATPSPAGSVTAQPAPTASAASPAPAGPPFAQFEIPALSSVTFLPDGPQKLTADGLSAPLRSGMALALVFQFSNEPQPLVVEAPVGVPLSPAPRDSPENEGAEGGHGDDG